MIEKNVIKEDIIKLLQKIAILFVNSFYRLFFI